jgi:hypothetical protein
MEKMHHASFSGFNFLVIKELCTSVNLIQSLSHSSFCECVNEELGAKTKARYRIDIYIGSDNDSRKIDESYLDKVKKWASATFPDGYTLVKGEGYYNGTSEDSILLHAFLNYDLALKRRLGRLKRELRQDSILVVKSSANFEVV